MYQSDGAPTDAQAIIDVTKQLVQAIPADGPHGLVVVNGQVVDYRAMIAPDHEVAGRVARTTKGFLDLVDKDRTDALVLFRDDASTRFEAVFDYGTSAKPTRDEHRAVFQPQPHPDWEAWAKRHGTWLEQVDFAEFVEERMDTIVTPDGADLLELSQDLRGHRGVEFQSSQRLADGQVQLAYVETLSTTKGGPSNGLVTIPPELVVETPIFRDGEPQRFGVFLRYRISQQGAVSFSLRIKRQDDIVPAALDVIAQEITDAFDGVPFIAGWHA